MKNMAKGKGKAKKEEEAKGPKAPSKLTAPEALEELAVLSESVEFEESFDESTPLKKLQKLVADGRKALADAALGGSDDEEGDDTDEDEVDLEEEAPKGKGAHVFDRAGKLVRTYTAKKHGKEYRALAKQFVEKNESKGYTTKESK